jgi:AhpC/TSA family/Disulphide bond corrector protein DsbC
VQLQSAKERFERQGIKLGAISYDSPAILKDFAERHKIEYPLLGDPESKIIAGYGVLNTEASGMQKGMALPGYFYIGADGFIREKYFEAKYVNRLTANNVLMKLFPELGEEVGQKLEAPHLAIQLTQSDLVVVPGSRLTLTANVTLPAGVHVYAPGVKGYKPVQLLFPSSQDAEFLSPTYPAPRILYLQGIRERVPIFEGKFRVMADAKISAAPELMRSLGADGRQITLGGELHYQACDHKTCYLPASVAVSWQVHILPLDLQRSPQAIQHK